jgi:hypothetical protein
MLKPAPLALAAPVSIHNSVIKATYKLLKNICSLENQTHVPLGMPVIIIIIIIIIT